MEAKAKEEAERKAEVEAQEIIDRVKANIAKEKEEGKKPDADKTKNPEAGKKNSKAENGKTKAPEKPKAETAKQQPETSEEKKEEDGNIYEREPVGEASMPKKSPKFKKGAHKKPVTGTTGSQAVKEAAATAETPEAEEAPKETAKSEEKAAEKPQDAATAETAEAAEPTVKKVTPESKAASDKEAKLQEQLEEAQDKYKRLLADFENARAREAKEASRMYDVGAKAVLEKLLPVVDNFERAIQTIPEEDKDRAFEQGVDKIYKQMMTILEGIGVAPMNAEGTEFNPDLHNAVIHVEDDAYGENVVAEEMQKGYMYKDSVLRYSMVKVAN